MTTAELEAPACPAPEVISERAEALMFSANRARMEGHNATADFLEEQLRQEMARAA